MARAYPAGSPFPSRTTTLDRGPAVEFRGDPQPPRGQGVARRFQLEELERPRFQADVVDQEGAVPGGLPHVQVEQAHAAGVDLLPEPGDGNRAGGGGVRGNREDADRAAPLGVVDAQLEMGGSPEQRPRLELQGGEVAPVADIEPPLAEVQAGGRPLAVPPGPAGIQETGCGPRAGIRGHQFQARLAQPPMAGAAFEVLEDANPLSRRGGRGG